MCKGPVGGECWTHHRNGTETRGWGRMSRDAWQEKRAEK